MSIETVPADIPSDGSSNVTVELNAWIDECPDGSVLQFGGGRFRIDRTIEVYQKHLELDGQGATFFTEDSTGGYPDGLERRARAHFRFVNSVIDAHHLQVIGPMTDGRYTSTKEAQHGFDCQCSILNLTDSMVRDVWGDFVYFGRQPGDRTPSEGSVQRCDFNNAGRMGISFTVAQDILIGGEVNEGNRIGNVQRAIFDFEPLGKGWGVERVKILRNTTGPHKLLWAAAGGSGPVNDIEVGGNTTTGIFDIRCGSGDGIRRHGWKVWMNQARNRYGAPLNLASYSPLSFYGVDDLVVAANDQPFSPTRGNCGVTVKDCVNPIIAWNHFTGAKAPVYAVGDNSAMKEGANQL